MVGTVAAPFSEHLGGNFDYFAGVTVVSELAGVSAVVAAGMVGIVSIGNAFAAFFGLGVRLHPRRRGAFWLCFFCKRYLLDTS